MLHSGRTNLEVDENYPFVESIKYGLLSYLLFLTCDSLSHPIATLLLLIFISELSLW